MKKTLLFAIILFAMGCEKDSPNQKFLENVLSSQRDQMPTEIQILDLLKLPTDGYAAITSYATLSTQPYRGPEVMIRAFGYDKGGNKSDFGNLNFGAITSSVTGTADLDYLQIGAVGAKDLYGNSTAVSLAGRNSLPGFNSTFYIPKMMTVTSPAYSNSSIINTGTTITWDADANNTFGVGIAIYYDPFGVENHGQHFSGNTVSHLIRTEDTGSYTITAADLADIPSGARLTFGIGRGNYQRVTMANDYHFGLIAYSVVTHSFSKY